MRRAPQVVLASLLAIGTALGAGTAARASISNSNATNVQNGRNTATTTQSGKNKSGDAVGGQVSGVVSSGRTSVDARNTSANSDVTSGDVRGGNDARSFVGLSSSEIGTAVGSDITNVSARNVQEGDNRLTANQTASYTTGDGVAGQVIGAVTAAGGSSSIVAANTTKDSDVTTGDVNNETNDLAAFVGLNFNSNGRLTVGGGGSLLQTGDINLCPPSPGPIQPLCLIGANVQEGNNRTTTSQSLTASTGDGVAGQVIGSVSAGRSSIDARNDSSNVSVRTGDAAPSNTLFAFTGLNDSDFGTSVGATPITPEDILNSAADNVQQGNNTATFRESAAAVSGDGVAGQVIGAVTSAGGSTSVVAANTSDNVDITTGKAAAYNTEFAFVGLNFNDDGSARIGSGGVPVGDIIDSFATNLQEGSNRLTSGQSATAHSGDGVGGQVLGIVSAGAASLDATNHTSDSSVETGKAEASNDGSGFVGLNTSFFGTFIGSDITGSEATNLQQGSNRGSSNQNADATSGDGVAGQVSGVVTSAGGSASVVLANTSSGIDSTSGQSEFDNTKNVFVGLNTDPCGRVVVTQIQPFLSC